MQRSAAMCYVSSRTQFRSCDPSQTLCVAAEIDPVASEADRQQTFSFPPVPTYDRAYQWVSETYRRSGMDVKIGAKLYSTFCAAGLPGPIMRMHSIIGGASACDEVHLNADQAMVLASDIERLGVATASELGIGNCWFRSASATQDDEPTEYHEHHTSIARRSAPVIARIASSACGRTTRISPSFRRCSRLGAIKRLLSADRDVTRPRSDNVRLTCAP